MTTTHDEATGVTSTFVPFYGRCSVCGQEVRLVVLTWEDFFAVRVRPHGAVYDEARGRTTECSGHELNLRRGVVGPAKQLFSRRA